MGGGVLDDIIRRLLEGKGGKQVQLSETEIRQLCINARQIFLSQPTLFKLRAPVRIVGDVHGQYQDLLRLFERGGYPPHANYLFLGDYVDRGKQSLETICLLLAYKIRYPDKIFLLRGNHEDAKINRIYGFYDECKRRFNVRLWKIFSECFNCLPVAAVVDEKILCMHGGLSPELKQLEQIKEIPRPTDIPDNGLLLILVWSAGLRVKEVFRALSGLMQSPNFWMIMTWTSFAGVIRLWKMDTSSLLKENLSRYFLLRTTVESLTTLVPS